MVTRSPVSRTELFEAFPCATFEEFLAQVDESTRAEWVDGRILYMSPASFLHQDLVRFLLTLLNSFVEAHDLGWVCGAPFIMHLPQQVQGREPDILFVARPHLHRIQATYLEGPADLAIEIVSPDSRTRDREEKRAEYEAAGVSEYWWIDPYREECEFLHLDEDGRYASLLSEEGLVASAVLPGFRLRIAWLWQQPLPKVHDAAAELGLL